MKEEKYMVMICKPLEAYPIDAQQLFIAESDIEQFLELMKYNDKAIILFPPEKYIREEQNAK